MGKSGGKMKNLKRGASSPIGSGCYYLVADGYINVNFK
jgi:hypothetical protein